MVFLYYVNFFAITLLPNLIMIKYIFKMAFACLFLIASFSLGALFYITQQPWVDLSILENYSLGKPSVLLDDQGNEWGKFQYDKREIISIKQIPQHLINAFIAAEDWQFFHHSGLSFKGIIRSILVNIYYGRKVQGASTITQQLIRLLFFDAQKSFSRKIKEQLLALAVERQFTKEQILETYLNHIYFGAGIYGVEAASQRFWGVTATDISLDQAAVLASIVQSPKRYCPIYNPQASLSRRNSILLKMEQLKFISSEQCNQATQKPIEIIKSNSTVKAPHLKEAIRIFLEQTIGKQALYTGGLKIQTTLNLKMQEFAESVFNEHIKKLRLSISSQLEGALMSIDRSTGAIKALVGGYNYQQSQFNRALKAKRQIGSTFKPLVYAAAITYGRSFADIETDEPITLVDNGQEWKPKNSNNRFDGPMTLARALAVSNNIISIKVLLSTGIQNVINLAKRCGLKAQLLPYPSLALGCIDGTLQEVAGMMNIFANNGIYVAPHYISWVKDQWDKKIWKNKEHKHIAMHWRISSQVAKILSIALEQAKKRQPSMWPTSQIIGKTGTTNDARTCWFAGSTPNLTTAVYIGCDDNRQLGKTTYASQTALPIWREFTKLVTTDSANFIYNKSLKDVIINARTGELTYLDDPQAVAILV